MPAAEERRQPLGQLAGSASDLQDLAAAAVPLTSATSRRGTPNETGCGYQTRARVGATQITCG
jgi:hypothetical protein